MVPKKGLEPPRCYSLVPETSASTNSATWAGENLKEEGFYIKTDKTSATLLTEMEGVVAGHRDGHGFVTADDGREAYLPPNEMRAVLHRDRVHVRIVRLDRRGRPEGRVLDIISRSTQPIIGRLLNENGLWLVAPEDKRYGQDVLIPKGGTLDAQPEQIVVVELTEPPSLYGQPVGRIIEVLGSADDSGMEIEIAVRKYGVPHQFSDACLQQSQALPDQVRPADKRGRIDLTDVALVTIDGEDARDFDDAVYCEPATVGRGKGWRLLVAIADVSNYVETGSAIDVDAYDRATSVYFPRRVIPMLPEKLSNGLCSLNPDVERLCMVCDMLVDAKGDVQAYQFYPAVMRSHARLTYTQVAAALANTRSPEAVQLKERLPNLLNLHDVYRALLQARQRRGAVDLDTVETQIVCDDHGRIEKILPRVRNDAHRVIEEAMLAANVCSADYIGQSKHLGLFRVHDGPTPEKVELLRQYLRALGLHFTISDEPTPAEFQAVSVAAKDRPDAQQIHTMLLRSMSQAIYSPINDGHFGLAYEAYTHFTSPIRRYPDLLVHRVIKAILQHHTYHLPQLPLPGEAHEQLAKRMVARNQRKGRAPTAGEPSANHKRGGKQTQSELQGWEAAGLHCSANERRADEASRDVQAWLKCQYMKNFLGEEFSGAVSAITSFGMFVTLDSIYVDGLVHITELGSEYFRFDEVRQELRGERSGTRYGIGTRVRIQVIRVDQDARKIDFALVDEFAELRAAKGNGNGHATGSKANKAGVPARARADLGEEGDAQRIRASRKAAPASPIAEIRRAAKKASSKKAPSKQSGAVGKGGKDKRR